MLIFKISGNIWENSKVIFENHISLDFVVPYIINDALSLGHSNTWFPVGGVIWVSLGRVPLLEGASHWGVDFEVSKP